MSYPPNPVNGQLWFDPNYGTLSYYYQDQDVWLGLGKGQIGFTGSIGGFDPNLQVTFQNTVTMNANLVVNNVTIGTSFEILNFSEAVKSHGTVTSSPLTIYTSNGNIQSMTLGADITLNLSNTGMKTNKGYSIGLVIKQDGSGNRNITFPTAVKWQGGYTPAFTKSANYTDIISMFTIDSGVTWYATVAGKAYI